MKKKHGSDPSAPRGQSQAPQNKKFTPEEINCIIDLKDSHGEQINVFELHGVLFIGNSEETKWETRKQWDITQRYCMFSEHSLGITIEDFADCTTPEEVNDTFAETLGQLLKARLY